MGKLFLWASGGYLLGHLFISFERADAFSLFLLTLAAVVGTVFVVSWRLSLLLFLTVIFAWTGFLVVTLEQREWQALPETVEGSVSGVITKRETSKTFYQPITIEPAEGSRVTTRVLWRAPRTAELLPGQYVRLECSLKRPENFDLKFDYRQHLAAKGVGYVCDEEKTFVVLPEEDRLRRLFFELQTVLRERIGTFLPDPAAGLMKGLLLGGDDELSQSVSDSFRRAGLSHIVAVSGYNMSLVAFAVLLCALFSGLWRKTATLLAALGILGFLLLIDTSAASVRAACMTWIVSLAFFIGRPATAWNGLFLAGLIMTLINPLLVRYDVGFQLSFMATLALIAAGPWFEIMIKRKGWLWKGVTLLLSTIVIELFIFPILAFHFGTITLIAPLANLFALPLIPLTMALGFLMLLLGSIIPWLGVLISLPVWLLLMVLILVGEFFGGMTWSMIDSLTPPPMFISLWYVVLALLVWYSRESSQRYVLRMDH